MYDSQNNEVAKLVSADSNRIPVSGDMITDNLAHAFVAIEDERFYEHKGIDAPGILRAAVIGVTSGNFSEGASTITQQLIKNNVFTEWTNETSVERIKRKLQEQYLAIELEKNMSKDTILLNYLNTINLGHGTLGVEAASQRYFDKSCNELTVSECAVLASIPQNPTQFDPVIYPEQNGQRREVVLQYMLNQGYLSQEDYEAALSSSRICRTTRERPRKRHTLFFTAGVSRSIRLLIPRSRGSVMRSAAKIPAISRRESSTCSAISSR